MYPFALLIFFLLFALAVIVLVYADYTIEGADGKIGGAGNNVGSPENANNTKTLNDAKDAIDRMIKQPRRETAVYLIDRRVDGGDININNIKRSETKNIVLAVIGAKAGGIINIGCETVPLSSAEDQYVDDPETPTKLDTVLKSLNSLDVARVGVDHLILTYPNFSDPRVVSNTVDGINNVRTAPTSAEVAISAKGYVYIIIPKGTPRTNIKMAIKQMDATQSTGNQLARPAAATTATATTATATTAPVPPAPALIDALTTRKADCPPGHIYTSNGCYVNADTYNRPWKNMILQPCRDGYTISNTFQCTRSAMNKGMSVMTCGADEDKIGASCYKKCNPGYMRLDDLCIKNEGSDTLKDERFNGKLAVYGISIVNGISNVNGALNIADYNNRDGKTIPAKICVGGNCLTSNDFEQLSKIAKN